MKLSELTRDEDGYLDPVCVDESTGLYYFYEETWAHTQGPFATEDDARRMLRIYADTLLSCRL